MEPVTINTYEAVSSGPIYIHLMVYRNTLFIILTDSVSTINKLMVVKRNQKEINIRLMRLKNRETIIKVILRKEKKKKG